MRCRSLLLLLAALLLGVGAIPDCREATPASPAPDLFSRCVKEDACQLCSRNYWSLDWLCCEDGNGWVALHVVNPFVFYYYFQHPVWTVALFVVWEVYEAFALTIMGEFVVFRTNNIDYETPGGALIGDVLNGAIGLWLAVMWFYIADFPLLVSTQWHASSYSQKNRRARYIVTWVLHAITAIAVGYSASDDTVRYGLYINIAAQLLFFWLLHPWVLYTDAENRMIWKSRADGSLYPEAWRYGFFYGSGAIVLLVQLSSAGWFYLANDWFQVWLTCALLGTALTVWASVVAGQRKDWYMLTVFIASYVLATGVALLLVGKLYHSAALLGTGAAFTVLATVALGVNALAQSRAQPYDVNYSRRSKAAEEKRPLTLKDNFKSY
jgi:hypothetical protein